MARRWRLREAQPRGSRGAARGGTRRMRGRGGAETPPWAGCAAAGWLGGAAPRRLGGAARERQAHGGAEGAGAGCLGGVAASSSKGGMEEGIADTDEEEAPTKGVAALVDSDGDGVAAPLEAAVGDKHP